MKNNVFRERAELIAELKELQQKIEKVPTGFLSEKNVKLFERLDEMLQELVRLEVIIQLEENDIIDQLQQQGKPNLLNHEKE